MGTDAPGLAELALTAIDDPGSALLVPYFDGERTPNLPDATGTFVGLTNTITPAQLALGAHDGVLCGLLNGVDALRRVGATIDGRVFLIGGGSRSVAYRQRCADLLGQTITVPDSDETVAAGAAVQAAAVIGGDPLDVVSARWSLGAGTDVSPSADGTAIRQRYATENVR